MTLVRTGHGYESGSRGRCDAFDGFEILAAPLGDFDTAARESRVFRRANGDGTDYGSHVLKLARRAGERERGRGGHGLYILVHHGAGREVWSVPPFYDGGALQDFIINMPEREQYALLYTMVRFAREASEQARDKTAQEYRQAFVEGRLKKTKLRGANVYKVRIESPAITITQ